MPQDSEESQSERRRAGPRFCQHFLIHCRSANHSAWHATPLKDFGRKGVRFMCELSFEPGEIIELKLGMPFCRKPVQVFARVVWKRQPFSGSMGGLSEHGVVFIDLDPAVGLAIEEIAQNLSRGKKF